MDDRPGCISGIIKLVLLGWLFDWLQDNFGMGRGLSCTGCGCGLILMIIFLVIACNIILSTNWSQTFLSLF